MYFAVKKRWARVFMKNPQGQYANLHEKARKGRGGP
jgi:hypothetical protein